MEKPKMAGKSPKIENLDAGKTYAWCACGRSSNQPWCDGSHAGTGFSPKLFTESESKKAALCMCKQTKNPPYCDGTHTKLDE